MRARPTFIEEAVGLTRGRVISSGHGTYTSQPCLTPQTNTSPPILSKQSSLSPAFHPAMMSLRIVTSDKPQVPSMLPPSCSDTRRISMTARSRSGAVVTTYQLNFRQKATRSRSRSQWGSAANQHEQVSGHNQE